MARFMADVCIMYHEALNAPEEFGAALTAEQGERLRWRHADELLLGRAVRDEPTVLIADGALIEHFGDLRALPKHVVILAADVAAASALGPRADVVAKDAADLFARAALLHAACRLAMSQWDTAQMEMSFARIEDETKELNRIGLALMNEHDRQALLELIVMYGKQLAESDGGGVLLVRKDEHGVDELRPGVFKLDSLPDIAIPTISFPMSNASIVGHAALTREPVVVADAHMLPPGSDFESSAEFERRTGYVARSMMAIPMMTRRDELLGVVFFINRKSDPKASIIAPADADRYIVPFTDRHVRLARALASIAAVAIENAWLYLQISVIFESVVRTAVSAVDARDPTTAGHSLRVATLATRLAEAVERSARGPYRDTHFSEDEMRELRFAALLHDFGKVAVREDVLVKAKKLPPVLWERVDARFDLIRRTIELEQCKLSAKRPCRSGAAGAKETAEETARIAAELAEQLKELDRLREVVRTANEPNLVAQKGDVELPAIAKRLYAHDEGHDVSYLTPDELRFLQLPRGTLDEDERAEVESHVEKTYQFLSQIPWTSDLLNVARYASSHHENLNGTGYPKRLSKEDIPLQTRIITLADVFDALTSSDRPYKAAVTPEKALDILRSEADAGLFDRDLVDILSESQVYKEILRKD